MIFESGTRFESELVDGQLREPGQVNNFFIFPGMSFGAMACNAKHIPERFFMVAAEAVAQCLDADDVKADSVLPNPACIREVGMNVAVAVVLEAENCYLARATLGANAIEVRKALETMMWSPSQDVM